MFDYYSYIHLIAGGVAGTAGAVLTCPLEVVKTRLQSSQPFFSVLGSPQGHVYVRPSYSPLVNWNSSTHSNFSTSVCTNPLNCCEQAPSSRVYSPSIFRCLGTIYRTEGPRALFKGLMPNLLGVIPNRGVYFLFYANTKSFLYGYDEVSPDSPLVHMVAAAIGGFMCNTFTNPIWFVKTRLQLHQGKLSAWDCIQQIYRQNGFIGFYKGISASYFGISETIVYFMLYEQLKRNFIDRQQRESLAGMEERDWSYLSICCSASIIAKSVASTICYPHELARTRLRQEGDKYRSFFQTLRLTFSEEGFRGLYRGLGTQLIRHIPNSAIIMVTYECIIGVLQKRGADADAAAS